jgi:hypothetical protein
MHVLFLRRRLRGVTPMDERVRNFNFHLSLKGKAYAGP